MKYVTHQTELVRRLHESFDRCKDQKSKYNYVSYYSHVLKNDFDSGNIEDK